MMRIEPLGDRALILRELTAPPAAVAHSISEACLPGVTDVVPCEETVGVYGVAMRDRDAVISACRDARSFKMKTRRHEIPVCYEAGPDLSLVAQTLELGESEVVQLHASAELQCFAIGFCPGFAYLNGLPAQLEGIPRLRSPRTHTSPGSVGITGRQTAVYPLDRPGGWPIIGTCPLTLVDVADRYFPIEVGDVIRFKSISSEEFEKLVGQRL